jgi:hypothetical protein
MSGVSELIEKEGLTVEQIRDFLDGVRESGRVNMYGSGKLLEQEFGLTRRQTRPIVTAYLRTGLRDD